MTRFVDILGCKEYSYIYEDGQIIRSSECAITISSDGFVTARTPICVVRYHYDTDGTLVKKRIIPANGEEQVIFYDTDENDSPVVKFTADGKLITSHSKTDSFGRKVFDELQLGTGFVSRQFAYHAGDVTDAHSESGKVKSSATTQLVSQIVLSDGRTLSYSYDAEERIVAVVESDGEETTATEYTYDALGQLLTETVDGVVINEMTYDNYGNILTKNGKVYTYGDSVWKDKLTAYNGQEISCDSQGNPVVYLGHSLTWEKGRQLKTFDSNTYTYNANGIRTSKTVNGVTHTYTLDGANILQEEWDGNTLIPLRDNEESVCGILYNGTPFYFLKNLQGDIIAITDANGDTVAKYTYDAWGKCTISSDTSTCNIATVNPYRYRGYYYDEEIAMYYLQSRYYDSEVGRFLNLDEAKMCLFATINDDLPVASNMYSYCSNDSIIYADDYGYLKIKISVAAKIIDAIILIVQIGAAIMAMKASFQMAKLVFKTAVKKTKKKLIDAIKKLIGSKYWKIALKAVFGFVIDVSISIAEFIVDLFLNMSLSYAILRAIYEFVPSSRKILVLK